MQDMLLQACWETCRKDLYSTFSHMLMLFSCKGLSCCCKPPGLWVQIASASQSHAECAA